MARAQRWLLRKNPSRAEKIGERFGRTFYRLSRKHRERALSNLELAFPEMEVAERTALAKRVFEHFGRMTADFLTSTRHTDEQIKGSVEIEGLHHLEDALAKSKGVMMITGHFGNWERVSAWLSIQGYKVTVIARDTRNSQLNDLVRGLREKSGTQVIPRGDAARPILERLKRNEIVGILPDQNTDDVFIPFFGKPAGTVLGPGVLSERTGSPVLPCWCVWTGPDSYRVIIEPALVPEPGHAVKGEGMMRAINASLENIVRKYPEQWLWFHDRWKSARLRGLL